MRFVSQQDYQTILKINRELINTVIDTPSIIYKLKITNSKINLYGESTTKTYLPGVQVACLIDRQLATSQEAVGNLDFQQTITFAFLRAELQSKSIYPETGDVVEFDSQYYEVNNINETQLYVGQVIYNHQILCECHLMRKIPLQLERPIV